MGVRPAGGARVSGLGWRRSPLAQAAPVGDVPPQQLLEGPAGPPQHQFVAAEAADTAVDVRDVNSAEERMADPGSALVVAPVVVALVGVDVHAEPGPTRRRRRLVRGALLQG